MRQATIKPNQIEESMATHMLCLKIMRSVMKVYATQSHNLDQAVNIDSMAQELVTALEGLNGENRSSENFNSLGALSEADKTSYYHEVKALVKMVL